MVLYDLLKLFDNDVQFEISIEMRGLEFHTGTLTKMNLTQDIDKKLYVYKLVSGNPIILWCYRSET